MAATPALDLDLVRTLVAIAEEGSFTRAADKVGRTQSAVSLQVQRLEALVGHRLVARSKGGGVELTARGQELVERGRALLALNDEIVRSFTTRTEPAPARLGFDGGYARPWVQDILARCAAAQPQIAVEVSRAGSCEHVPRMKAGELDLVICEGGLEPRRWPAIEVWREPLRWIVSDAHPRHRDDPLPLALVPGECPLRPPWLNDCLWRDAAMRALERGGRRYRIVTTSATIWGLHDAVLAGLAVTAMPASGLPAGLRPARPEEGLPELPEVRLLMLKAQAPRQPATDALAALILEAFGGRARPESASG